MCAVPNACRLGDNHVHSLIVTTQHISFSKMQHFRYTATSERRLGITLHHYNVMDQYTVSNRPRVSPQGFDQDSKYNL
jgi:hypothetical protein